jgi:integration host factor subunit beta
VNLSLSWQVTVNTQETEAALLLTSMLIKSQLIAEISKELSHLPEKDIALAVNTLIEYMSSILSEGGRIEIRGFGSFCLHFRPPRKAHNPKTGEKLVTNPKYVVHFKPGKELRERVNGSRHIPLQNDLHGDSDEGDE